MSSTTHIPVNTLKISALRSHLGLEAEEGEIEVSSYDDCLFSVDRTEYLICTEDEANERATDYIKESLWAFDARFLSNHMPCTRDLSGKEHDAFISVIESCQKEMCESCNTIISALVGNNLERLINDAISCDGLAHFLNTYDNEEHEHAINGVVEFYIYRIS